MEAPTVSAWASRPLGKTARVMMAACGIFIAFMLILVAAMVDGPSWAMVLGGAALAATSVRAARAPVPSRLALVAINIVALPLMSMI